MSVVSCRWLIVLGGVCEHMVEKQTVRCSGCLSDVDVPLENVAVGKCPDCDALLPFDEHAAEQLALARLPVEVTTEDG